ncbi:MAG: CapA family protein [Eubacteriales bacterium]|nr:CapA family protein [Eubacteriales bacterium]
MPEPKREDEQQINHDRQSRRRKNARGQRRRSQPLFLVMILVLLGLVLFAWHLTRPATDQGKVKEQEASKSIDKDNEVSKEKSPSGQKYSSPSKNAEKRATIAMVGDVLIHQSLLNSAARPDGSFEFAPLFRYMKPMIQGVDLAAFDMEGVLKGPPYAGYPSFSVPESIAFELKDAGFDLAISANNHAMDFDVPAMVTCAENLRKAGLEVVGTRVEFDDPKFTVQEIKGMKIGFTAFTYESERILWGNEYLRALNQVPISDENAQLVDSVYVYNQPDLLEVDAKRISDRVEAMRKAGAEAIVFFFHWGTEYALDTDFGQDYYSQLLADLKVDVCLGAGPHVIQPIRSISSQDGKHDMLCYFSVGNFVSNQQYDTGGSEGRAQDGLVALISFSRDRSGDVRLDKCGYLAHTMYKEYPHGEEEEYTVGAAMPIEAALAQPEDYALEAEGLTQVEAAQARIETIMQANDPGNFSLDGFSSLEDFLQ